MILNGISFTFDTCSMISQNTEKYLPEWELTIVFRYPAKYKTQQDRDYPQL